MADVYQALDSEVSDAVSLELRQEAESMSMIIVLGETGAGKSHFINTLAPDSCKVSAGLTSCTSKPSAVALTFDGNTLLLIDTPGFNDTRSNYDRSDSVVLAEIAEMISVQSALGVQMKGILYLHDINQQRMTGEAIRQLTLLREVCGEHNFDHVALVTTKWPDEATQKKHSFPVREKDLRRIYWRPMISAGSCMLRFEDTEESATSIIRSLIGRDAVEFALQKELVQTGSLADTAAGKFVIAARKEDEKKLQSRTLQDGQSKRDGKLLMDVEIAELQKSIDNRKSSERVLVENIVKDVNERLNTTIEKEYETTGKRPSVAKIFSLWNSFRNLLSGFRTD